MEWFAPRGAARERAWRLLIALSSVTAADVSAISGSNTSARCAAWTAVGSRHFKPRRRRLTDYPLYPYLDYADHPLRLHQLTGPRVTDFRARWSDTPMAARLYEEWMDDLARRGAWDVFIANYEAAGASADASMHVSARTRSQR